MKVRKLMSDLRKLGCRPKRCNGSHGTWTTPGGVPFTLVVNHPGADVSATVLASVRRVLRKEGLDL